MATGSSALTRLHRARTRQAVWLEAAIPREYIEVPGMEHDAGGLEIAWEFLGRT